MAKYTIEFSDDVERVLNKQSKEKKVTKADVIRKAISTYVYLSDAVKSGPSTSIQIVDEAGNRREVILP